MENFSVKLSGLSQRIEEEKNIITGLGALESDIMSVRSGLSFQIKNKENITDVLKKLADNVSSYASDMKKLRSTLSNVRSEYEKTERRICGYANDHPISAQDVWNAFTTVGEGLCISAVNPVLGFGWLVNEILKDEEWEKKSEWGNYEHTLWDKWDEKKKNNILDEHYEWKDGKLVKKEKEDSSDDKKEKTDAQKRKEILENITIWSGSVAKEGSLIHLGKDGDVETDWGSYTYSADFMKAEASASLEVTMGGVEAEIGVALTAFTAEAAGQLGSDYLNVHGSGQVTVGKVEGKAQAGVGIWDDEGNFDPKLYAKASAEAIAWEASGEVGVNIGGVEGNVKGSVNFGIGAHVDVGFDDGKFSLDVGASLGIGGSVKLELDVGGLVDKGIDFVQDVGGAAADAYNAAADFVSDVADNVTDFMDGVGNAISSGWSTFKSWF